MYESSHTPSTRGDSHEGATGQAPSTAQDRKNPIEKLSHIHTSGQPSWFGWRNQGLKDRPFGIRKVACIGFIGKYLLIFRLFFFSLPLLYNTFSAWCIPFNWL